MIKRSVNGTNLEYLTIKMDNGLNAQQLSILALMDVRYDDEKRDDLLNCNNLKQIMKHVKNQILDNGVWITLEIWGDFNINENDIEKLSQTIVDLTGGKIEWK